MDVALHRLAQRELRAALAWYQDRDASAGNKFIGEVSSAIVRIRQRPMGRAEFEPGLRRVRLRGFPYNVVYWVGPDRIVVMALVHDGRKPGYRRKRLRQVG